MLQKSLLNIAISEHVTKKCANSFNIIISENVTKKSANGISIKVMKKMLITQQFQIGNVTKKSANVFNIAI